MYFLLFKSKKIGREFTLLDPRLQFVIYAYAAFMWHNFKVETVVTCIWRMGGVHEDYRGVDVRTKDILADYTDAGIQFVNEILVYDPDRPGHKVAHDERETEKRSTKATGPHIHFQSDPRGKMSFNYV